MDKKPPPQDKMEFKFMATPITSTPILKGKDLVDLVNDLKKPDKGKERRRKAMETLIIVTSPSFDLPATK